MAASSQSRAALPTYNGDWVGWTDAVNTHSFNQSAGTDQILIVRLLLDQGTGTTSATVTFNGVPLTLLRADSVASGTTPPAFIYYLVNPPVGNYTLSVVHSPAWGGWRRVEAFSYSNVNQSTPFGAHNASTNSGTTSPSVLPFTPTTTNSTVVELDWWQGAYFDTGYSTNYGSTINSWGGSLSNWHQSGISQWNPPSTAPVTINQAWTGGWGTAYTAQAFELLASGPAPTPTPTAGPIELSKTANVSVASIGDTITFCLHWSNGDNKPNPITIWDTVPSALTYVGCDSGCSYGAGLVNWDLGSQGIATSGSVCFWGTVNGVP